MHNIRVLHAPTTVGGNPQGLSKALCRLGVRSQSLTFAQNVYNYQADVVIWQADDPALVREVKRWVAMLRFLPKTDVVHYNFGMTMATPPLMLPRKGKGDATGSLG